MYSGAAKKLFEMPIQDGFSFVSKLHLNSFWGKFGQSNNFLLTNLLRLQVALRNKDIKYICRLTINNGF